MSIYLGLDVGNAKIGVAISYSGVFAEPYEVYKKEGKFAEKKILEVISNQKIKLIIVGMPLSDNGEENEQCQIIRSFTKRLRQRCESEFIFIDEYGTSINANHLLNSTGNNFKDRAKKEDAVAAALILQSYLDNNSLGFT